MENVAGAAVGGILGLYVIRVGMAGHSKDLLTLLSEESGYLELLVALYALYLIHEQGGPLGSLTDQLMWMAVIAALIKAVAAHSDLFGELEKFGNGQQGLFTSLKHIAGIQ